MKNIKTNIVIILSFISLLGITIQITRLDLLNIYLDKIQITEKKGEKLDEEIAENLKKEEFLIIYEETPEFLQIKSNIQKALLYMKKEYVSINIKNLNYIDNRYENIIIIMENINEIKELNSLMSNVLEGGSIFFANRLAPSIKFNSISNKLGILEYGVFEENEGFILVENLLPKTKGLEIYNEDVISNSSVALQLNKNAKSYGKSQEGSELLWTTNYGKGKIVYFNGTMLKYIESIDFIAGMITLMTDDAIYPVIKEAILDESYIPYFFTLEQFLSDDEYLFNNHHLNEENKDLNNYKWLKKLSPNSLSKEISKVINSEPYFIKRENQINIFIDNFLGNLNLVLRTDKEIIRTENCTAKKLDEETYLVTVKKPISEIFFEGR